MLKLSLPVSGFLLLASIAGFLILSHLDKKSGEDRYRVYTSLTGIAGMLFLFYFLANLLIAAGFWK